MRDIFFSQRVLDEFFLKENADPSGRTLSRKNVYGKALLLTLTASICLFFVYFFPIFASSYKAVCLISLLTAAGISICCFFSIGTARFLAIPHSISIGLAVGILTYWIDTFIEIHGIGCYSLGILLFYDLILFMFLSGAMRSVKLLSLTFCCAPILIVLRFVYSYIFEGGVIGFIDGDIIIFDIGAWIIFSMIAANIFLALNKHLRIIAENDGTSVFNWYCAFTLLAQYSIFPLHVLSVIAKKDD